MGAHASRSQKPFTLRAWTQGWLDGSTGATLYRGSVFWNNRNTRKAYVDGFHEGQQAAQGGDAWLASLEPVLKAEH